MAESDYQKYRGRCLELSKKACDEDPTLRLVRGHYYDPMWGKQAHWWCERPDVTILDPTAAQFPSKGKGHYEEFNGIVECAECGKQIKLEDADIEGNYAFCSYNCHGRFVGVF